jgi:hypothetical protein
MAPVAWVVVVAASSPGPQQGMGEPAAPGWWRSTGDVNDRSTDFFMIRFHELWHGRGLTPAAALAEAQRSLRTANAQKWSRISTE